MAKYPKYATTVIGAHSVPDWFEALDRLVAVGQLSMAALADAQFRSTEAAVLDQEIAGIDWPVAKCWNAMPSILLAWLAAVRTAGTSSPVPGFSLR